MAITVFNMNLKVSRELFNLLALYVSIGACRLQQL